MYTAIRLMRIGWKFSGDESLGMAVIEDQDSAWYGIKPVPRMIQNQLGHLLELNIIELDRKILKDVQTLMEKRTRRLWLVTMLAVFLLLHVRELDRRRNIFWSRYNDSVCSLFKVYDQTYSNDRSSDSGYTRRSLGPSLMKRSLLVIHYCRISTVQ